MLLRESPKAEPDRGRAARTASAMFTRVLFVCSGNICRSPMAEALLAHRLRARGVPATVESAGIAALVGRAADPDAVRLMRARGLDLTGHRARQITPELIRAFELIIVMEGAQQRLVETLDPVARGRVQRIGRFGGFDVPDPHRRGPRAFERSLALIERGLDGFDEVVWRARR